MPKTPDRGEGDAAHFDFSVIVCTRNRAEALDTALTAILRLTYAGNWELVVIDNGSTDNTPDVIRRHQAGSGIPFRTVREDEPGLARARNAGVVASRGRWLAFTDDDCYPDPQWLTIAGEVANRPAVGIIGGRILLFDPADARYTIQERTDAAVVEPGSFVEPGFIQGANLLICREVFMRVGGFDRDFGAGTPYACEDADLICRASFAGFGVVYEPRLVVSHHHRRRPGPDIERLTRWYAFGRGAYYAKFLLDGRSRRVFAQNLYWRWRHPAYRAAWPLRLRELAGAIRFCGLAIGRLGRDPHTLPA